MDFMSSTHHHHWVFSAFEVIGKYRVSNQRAQGELRKHGASRAEGQRDGSLSSYPSSTEEEENGVPVERSFDRPLPETLSLEEEFLIQAHYQQKLQVVCAEFAFPSKVQATAILYFKRFYLKWSVMEHDPKHIMLTCIYVACKIEEFYVSAEEFCKAIRQDPRAVLTNETNVLQALDFELIVYTPYRALDGYACQLMDSARRMGVTSLNEIQELKKAAILKVDEMMLTNAPLLFPPGQLAMAALRSANREERKIDLEQYMKDLSESLAANHPYSELASVLDAIDSVVRYKIQTSESEAKRIDRKLKLCRHNRRATSVF